MFYFYREQITNGVPKVLEIILAMKMSLAVNICEENAFFDSLNKNSKTVAFGAKCSHTFLLIVFFHIQ